MPCQSSGRRTTSLYVAALLYGLILCTFLQPSMGQRAQEGEQALLVTRYAQQLFDGLDSVLR